MTLEFTDQQLQALGNALGYAPFNVASPILMDINRQLQANAKTE